VVMIGCYVAGTSAASLSSTSAADIAAVGAAIVVLGAVGAVTAFRSRHGCGLAASVGCCAVAAALEALCIIVAILTSSAPTRAILLVPAIQIAVVAVTALVWPCRGHDYSEVHGDDVLESPRVQAMAARFPR
jgi:hypothetical protein